MPCNILYRKQSSTELWPPSTIPYPSATSSGGGSKASSTALSTAARASPLLPGSMRAASARQYRPPSFGGHDAGFLPESASPRHAERQGLPASRAALSTAGASASAAAREEEVVRQKRQVRGEESAAADRRAALGRAERGRIALQEPAEAVPLGAGGLARPPSPPSAKRSRKTSTVETLLFMRVLLGLSRSTSTRDMPSNMFKEPSLRSVHLNKTCRRYYGMAENCERKKAMLNMDRWRKAV